MAAHVAIVGAGIMGRVLAWQLRQDAPQLAITLYDKDGYHGGSAAAYTAAGMLAPYSELLNADSRLFALGRDSLSLWPDFVASLKHDVDFQQQGTVVVAHRQDNADYRRFLQHVQAKLPPQYNQDCTVLAHQQLQRLSPQLSARFDQAVHFRHEAWVDGGQLMGVLAECLLAKGVSWLPHTEVLAFTPQDEKVTIQSVNTKSVNTPHSGCIDSSIAFDWVIDCRGMGAKKHLPGLRGVRGEVITLHAPQVELQHALRLIHPRYSLYLVPRKQHIFVLGASQIETEDYGPITVGSALELLSAAYSIDGGFAEARIVKTAANCRPALADNLPQITLTKRLMSINGLFRHGFLLAPLLARQAASLILHGSVSDQYKSLLKEVLC